MRPKQAFFYSPKSNEWLILTANRNQAHEWYDYLPVRIESTNGITMVTVYDHGEFSTLKGVPAEYLRISPLAIPETIQNLAKGEL